MSVEKICSCDEARWPKCAHPWYLPKFRWQGKAYKPNLTRHAREVAEPPRELNAKTDADAYAEEVRTQIRNGSYLAAKTKKNMRGDAGIVELSKLYAALPTAARQTLLASARAMLNVRKSTGGAR